MTRREVERLARVAYEAYAESTGGKTFRGEDMLEFDALPINIRQAWAAAAKAVHPTWEGA